jgi:response regulator RpfG family c-di-GMP phosphodiesterase
VRYHHARNEWHQLFAEIQMNHEQLANIPFIFLTALSDKDNMVTALRAGAADYLTKPVDFDLLMAPSRGWRMTGKWDGRSEIGMSSSGPSPSAMPR